LYSVTVLLLKGFVQTPSKIKRRSNTDYKIRTK
jgi:hypothetical protein